LVKTSLVSRISPSAHASASDMTGRRVGPYQLSGLIGHGGMGSVYLGVRDDDHYSKQVAIKLMKRGMDTDFMLSRFRQERQILANLEHPFIARLMDGGATEDGLPYFVMEYVEGAPITTYCREKALTVPERLRLFRLVCEAVQHAHQNLVVHRDIKPGNILITQAGVPKLLDFGIAKVVDPGAAPEPAPTLPELRMLTPDYASPEQVKGLSVSTASDIYSLGAVLYELLAGERPHRFRSGSLIDMEAAVCQVEPVKPSVAAGQNTMHQPVVRKQLRRQLCGDLDNIVLTAIRKEPLRRYASAAELSEDLRRHLEGLPIVAQEDRWSYRAGKFIRRNKLGVAAALLILATLIGGIATTSIQARRAERRFQMVRGLANSMLFDLHDQMARLPGSTALRAAMLRTVVKYLDTLVRDGVQDPDLDLEIAVAYEHVAGLEGHPFRSNLGHGAAALSNYRKALVIYERLAIRPEFRVRAFRGLIDTHLNISGMEAVMGNPGSAASHFKKASALVAGMWAPGAPELPRATLVNAYFRLADAVYERGDANAELVYYRNAVEVCRKWIATDQGAEAIGNLRDSLHHVGNAQARAGDLYGARDSFAQARKVSDELLRKRDIRNEQLYNAISLYTSSGDLLAAADDPNFGDRAGALTYYQKALSIAQDLATADPRNVNAARNLESCYRRLGMMHVANDVSQGLEYYRNALTIAEELSAADPPNLEYRYALSRACMGVGEALNKLGNKKEAIQNLTRAVDIQNGIATSSPERIWNLRVLSRTYALLGNALLEDGDHDRALDALREGLAVADRMLRRAPSSLYHQLDRADVLEALGAYYLTVAAGPRVIQTRRKQLKQEARSSFEGSLAIWRDWTRRKVGAPYASRRENRVAAVIASIGQS
jgi:tetratricopeptide (TPR) repeat protein